jgi:hypothetical protein
MACLLLRDEGMIRFDFGRLGAGRNRAVRQVTVGAAIPAAGGSW